MLWELNRREEAQPVTWPSGLCRKVLREFFLSLRSKACGLGFCLGKLVGQACSLALLGMGEAGMWIGEAWQGSLAGEWPLSSQGFADQGNLVGNAGICCRLIMSILQSAPGLQERWDPQVLQPQVEASRFKRSACFLCAL